MPALLALVPFRDWAYAAIAIAAVVFYNVHVDKLEHGYAAKQTAAVEAADKAATDRTLRAAKDAIDAKDKMYAIQLTQVEDTYETQLQTADAQHASDLQRVRQLSAAGHSDSGAVLSNAGSSETGCNGGAFCVAVLGTGAALADALRRDDAQLQKCWDERDSVAGK